MDTVHWQNGTDEEELSAAYGYELGQIDSVTQTALTPAGAFGSTAPVRSWTRTFDGTGIFVESEMNSLGHQTGDSPDPFIGDPLRAVDYDPFAYVLNRPLRFTDPTGYQADQRVNFTTSDIEASLDSHVVFGDPVTGSTGFGSATVEYNYGLLGGAEDTTDADLQLELDAVSVENAVGLEEFAQQYMPEPPPLNPLSPDRISLPRVPPCPRGGTSDPQMTRTTLYADFHNADPSGRVRLNLRGTGKA